MPILLLATTAWGQVDISRIKNISNNSIQNLTNRSNGQGPTASANNSPDSASSEQPNGIEEHEDIPDSILQGSVFAFHRQPLEVKIMGFQHPSLSPTGGQFCDVLDAFNGNYYLTVTEMGHPHRALAPTLDCSLGLTHKESLYPLFYKTPDNILFYQVKNPYAVLAYHSSLTKDYQLHVTHTQNINEHWNYALDYHLINPDGAFANSAATDHFFDFNTNYYSRDNRYLVAAGFIWQRMVLGENGGLANPDWYINKRNSNLSGLPVNDNSRMSFGNDVTVFVRQSFNTVRQVEWYRPIKQKYTDTVITYDTILTPRYDSVKADTIFIDSILTNTHYEIRDSIIGYDTILPNKPHSYNTGVVALDLQWDKQKYRYIDSTICNHVSARLYWTNDAYLDYRWHNPLKLYGGIRPEVMSLRLDQYATTLKQVALYPFAEVAISPWPASELNVYAEATPTLSEYNLDAKLMFPFRDTVGNSVRRLSIHAVVQAHSPELIYSAQCLHPLATTADNFHTVGVRKLEADYERDELFSIHLCAQHVDHNIWFRETELGDGTSNYMPEQTDSNALLLQGRVNLFLSLGSWFHYDMQQMVQYSSDQNQIRVPLFASKNSFYADFHLFKNALHSQVGFDLRYHTAFKADGYDPSLGIFYRQDEEKVGNYLWADFFINLQIKRATIYLKAGHFNSFLEKQAYFMLPGYPSKQFGLSFGLTWKFFD